MDIAAFTMRTGSMLLWILVPVGLTLLALSIWLPLSMFHAERRARRSLYRALGLAESTVEYLMERNRDVLTELSYVRRDEEGVAEAIQVAQRRPSAGSNARPNLRLVQPPETALMPGELPATSNERPTHH